MALPEDRSPEAPITACLARLAASPAKALPTVAALASSNPTPNPTPTPNPSPNPNPNFNPNPYP